MCGITGYFSPTNKISPKNFYSAHKKISHRGPDDEGFLIKQGNELIKAIGNDSHSKFDSRTHITKLDNTNLILGHRRLSILDLSEKGHQPYQYKNLTLTFNGEIYNFKEIREELMTYNYSFESNSDTEVLIKAFHKWGVKSFNKFNGMWALAIYDQEKNEIYLSRDRIGIKPLYYFHKNSEIIWASEIKAITPLLKEVEVNPESVFAFLRYGYSSHNQATFFKDIKQLEPGTYAIISNDSFYLHQFWSFNDAKRDFKEVKSSLLESIKLRSTVADVEVASLLSGGIDSSFIIGAIKKDKLKHDIQTFSATSENFSDDPELYYINKTIKEVGFTNHQIPISPKEEDIDKLIYTLEQPLRGLSEFAQYSLYKSISKKNIKVVLSGLGADEIFSGYSNHIYFHLLDLLKSIRLPYLFREIGQISKDLGINKIKIIEKMIRLLVSRTPLLRRLTWNKNRMFLRKFCVQLPFYSKSYLRNDMLQNIKFSALREYLSYNDKNSMQSSIESRVPFLDHNLVEATMNIPNELLVQGGQAKFHLRELSKEYILKDIYERKDKKGFFIPLQSICNSLLADSMDKIFEEIGKHGLFDFVCSKQVSKLYQKYKQNPSKHLPEVWRIYTVYKWKKVWNIR